MRKDNTAKKTTSVLAPLGRVSRVTKGPQGQAIEGGALNRRGF